MLNIRTHAVAAMITFALLDAEDQPLVDAQGKPCRATIHGPGSRVYIAAQSARQAKLMGKLQKNKEPIFTADEELRSRSEFLAAITDDIELGYDDLEGREKHLAIFGDPELGFIAEQVTKKAGDWANFSKGSAKS